MPLSGCAFAQGPSRCTSALCTSIYTPTPGLCECYHVLCCAQGVTEDDMEVQLDGALLLFRYISVRGLGKVGIHFLHFSVSEEAVKSCLGKNK